MTAEHVAQELGGRRSGCAWICRCPAHDDRSPSLSITERNGKILVRCFAGCSQSEVIDVLRSRGLWPKPECSDWTEAERRNWAAQRRKDERDMHFANWFRMAAVALGDELLEVMPSCDLDRGPITQLLVKLNGGDSSTLNEYRQWRRRWPRLTNALVRAGRKSDERLQTRAARWLMKESTHAA